MKNLYPLRLEPSLREKPWGLRDLGPYFGLQARSTGEVWYTGTANRVANGELVGRTIAQLTAEYGPLLDGRPPGESGLGDSEACRFPILAKLLFVSQKLSVQVHPDDEYASRVEGCCGKTEMWHVVAARPGAAVALGLTEPLNRADLIAHARSGAIERYLNWVTVSTGDTLFVPAGLVHTIGPGVTICEIQQHSDITYRLFDYGRRGPDGRPRELHLDKAADVVRSDARHTAPAAIELPPGNLSATERLSRRLIARCEYFAAERLEWSGRVEITPDSERFELLIVLTGSGVLAGETYKAGDAFLLPAQAGRFAVDSDNGTTAMRAYPPNAALLEEEIAAAAIRSSP